MGGIALSQSELSDVSAELKARREKCGLSLEDLFERTRINLSFLKAIEAGNFEALPRAYVRLFLKRYAQEVGLSSSVVLSRYETLRALPSPSPEPVEDAREESSRRRPVLIFAVTVAMILAVGIGSFALRGGKFWPLPGAGLDVGTPTKEAGDPVERRAGDSMSGARPGSDVDAVPRFEARPGSDVDAVPRERVVLAYSFSTGLPSGHQDSVLSLSVEASRVTNALVLADDEIVFTGMLLAGDTGSWRARQRFRVEVDEADALVFSLQGRRLKPIGKPGHKLRLQVSRKSVWVEEVLRATRTPPNPSGDL
jgi:transcriptional regulator with XRE-family HTH domain